MSIELTSIAYSKQLQAKHQRVLVLLCDFANDAGVCWPSIGRVAWKLGVSDRTVIRAINDLEAMGAVEVRRRHGHANIYLIRLDCLPDKPPYIPPYDETAPRVDGVTTDTMTPRQNVTPDNLSSESDKMSPQNGQNVTSRGDKMSPKPPGEPSEEPSKNHHTARASLRESFEQFRQAYPRGHINPKSAWDAWQRLNPDPELVELIMIGLERWKASDQWQRGYVKHAHNWLDQAWWDMDPPEGDDSRPWLETPDHDEAFDFFAGWNRKRA